MDENADVAIADGLRRRRIDIIAAQEDGRRATEDSIILDRASELRKILFTNDDDLIQIAVARLKSAEPFPGVFYIHQEKLVLGHCIDDLELVCATTSCEEWQNQIMYLPL